MKKVFSYILTFILIFAFGDGLVKAENLTFEEIVEKVKVSNAYKSLIGSGILVDITSTDDTLTISYPTGDERSTIFNYEDDIISYKFNASKNDEYTMSRAKLDAQWIVTLLEIISEPKGYTLLHLQTLTLAKLKEYTLEENGIDVTTFRYTYVNPENNETIETSAYDTFNINIKKLDLKINIDENINNDSNKDEEEITFVEPKAKPESITIKDIAEKLPDVLKKVYGEQFGELVEDGSNFSVEYDYNTITIFQEIDKKKETLRTLTINNGVISHEYIYDTELGIDGERIVNVFIYKSIFMTIGEIYGYTEKELEFLYKDFFEGIFDEKGYEFVSTKEKSTFKIDMNRFNLEKISEDEVVEDIEINNNTNNNERNSGNPIVFVIMIIIVILALCLLFYINRDMFGNMLRNKYRR